MTNEQFKRLVAPRDAQIAGLTVEVAVLLARLETLEKQPSALVEAVRLLSKDMHNASSRPCPTCMVVSKVLGEPFGCEARLAIKRRGPVDG